MAPEVIKHNYSKEADIWSIGVILYILLSGRPPFYGSSEEAIYRSIVRQHIDLDSSLWKNISASGKDLISKTLCRNPAARLTAEEILNHPWVRGGRRAVGASRECGAGAHARLLRDEQVQARRAHGHGEDAHGVGDRGDEADVRQFRQGRQRDDHDQGAPERVGEARVRGGGGGDRRLALDDGRRRGRRARLRGVFGGDALCVQDEQREQPQRASRTSTRTRADTSPRTSSSWSSRS